MSAKRIAVWRDTTPVDDDREWIVSIGDKDDSGAEDTISVHATRRAAIDAAECEALRRNLDIEIEETRSW
jgi:Uncharacterized protein conserved in bacteria (DUF2188)